MNDDIASDLQGVEIVLNKQATIIKRDIKVANGYIHHIDNVLDIVTKTVYDILSETEQYSIFTAGLDECGFKDTLGLTTITFGNTTPRVFYTVLAVPDSLYERDSIYNLSDLIAKYDTDGDHKSDTNGFFQYMENHLISGTNYFTSFNKTSTVYYLITQNSYIQIIDEERVFKINKALDNSYTEFYYKQSNIPAKNGCIHTINSQLPANNTTPIPVLFQVTEHFDMQQGEYYQKYYARFYDGQNDFKGIKWDGDYLMYYFNRGLFMDNDGLNVISSGYFWIEVTTPKIRKGKYGLSSFHFGGDGSKSLNVYIDGIYIETIASSWNTVQNFGPVIFNETKEHKIKFESAVSTYLFWDYVLFTPQ
ncbi:MAG: hypothetical protein WCX31_21190 [Salinivirgaceae bacterium]